MRRLLTSTTALSVALAFSPPLPVMAQSVLEDGKVVATDGTTVLCDPATGAVCDLAAIQAQVQTEAAAADASAQAEAEAAAQAAAEAAIAAQADADAAAQAEAAAAAQAEADAAATAQAEADAAAAAQADADAAAAAQAQADADAAAAAQAQADADAAAAAQAQADADAAAAVQAEADAAAQAQAQADADAAAAAQEQADADASAAAAQAQADADAAAAAQAEADAAAASQAQADADAAAAAQAQADADASAAAQADAAAAAAEAQVKADAAAAAQAQAEADAAAALLAEEEAAARAAAAIAAGDAEAAAQAQADADAAAAETAAAEAAAAAAQADADAAAATAEADAQAQEAAAADRAEADAAAAAAAAAEAEAAPSVETPATPEETVVVTEEATPEAPVEAPVPTETAVEGLTAVLEEPTATEGDTERAAPVAEAAAAAAAAPLPEGTKPSDVAAPNVSVVVTQTVTEADTRSSAEEFTAAPVAVSDGKKSGLSNLEKVGLVALGALVVGAVINENNKRDRQEVVSNTGDRVVVQRPDGSYQIYKDDDAILRRPGSEVRTETYRDGSTRTIVEKRDGTQVVTVRDASGRVLRRATYDDRGRELVLFDDMQPERAIIVSDLPRARPDRVTISTNDADAALKARLAARQAEEIGRSFSLRQIREIAQVRDLAATINVDNITFDSGSSAIRASEAEKLADLGGLITDLIRENPGEVFLIEGHTDAVGSGASNLALSDRRAESVALALTEYFEVPPENIVVQGYGEKELRIDTQGDERANRRVAVRIITPLMNVASN